MNKTLSIVIPVYNMEKHLERCLSSVLYDDSPPDVEIIIINDGSKDNSKHIVDKYAQLYPSQAVVIHKENGGWGSCINIAMQRASGKYFRILDSDDEFDRLEYAQLVSSLRSLDVDMHLTGYTEIYPNEERRVEFDSSLRNRHLSIEEYYRAKVAPKRFFALAEITYRTSILRGENFTPRYYADLEYISKPFVKVRRVLISNLNVYRYYRTYDEQSTSIQGYIRNKENFLKLAESLSSFLNSTSCLRLSRYVYSVFENQISRNVLMVYNLFLSHEFGATDSDALKLRAFDKWLKINNKLLYNQIARIGIKYCLPYVSLWRYFNINLKKRQWI